MFQASQEEAITDGDELRDRVHEVVNGARIESGLAALPRKPQLTDAGLKVRVVPRKPLPAPIPRRLTRRYQSRPLWGRPLCPTLGGSNRAKFENVVATATILDSPI
jgi:hypothetical protein